jgi:glycosyltransferase involved in cell wall biosynthesis
MKILFLDQSGKLGGAELSLVDVAQFYCETSVVGLFEDGIFRQFLEQNNISVRVLATKPLQIRKESHLFQSLGKMGAIFPLILQVSKISRNYDLIYANTQKALVVGAIASLLCRRPLVFHLRDILSSEHFSSTNRRVAITLANRCASLVIANSQATKTTFIEAGGRADFIEVVYNGFEPENYRVSAEERYHSRQKLGLDEKFIVGHFSRLSPWKGQHILLEALTLCPQEVVAIFVGDALFGEFEYVTQLHQKVIELGLENRVKFLGFRSDVIPLMNACDLVAHTSTSPEPFGRVIVEAMLCGCPVVAAAAGGAIELVETGKTGWLVPPGNPNTLAEVILSCYNDREQANVIANHARNIAKDRFQLSQTQQQIDRLLQQVV